jgi:hypothetical protein
MSVQFDSSRNRWVCAGTTRAASARGASKDAQEARVFDDEQRSAKAAARQAGAVEPAAQQAGS